MGLGGDWCDLISIFKISNKTSFFKKNWGCQKHIDFILKVLLNINFLCLGKATTVLKASKWIKNIDLNKEMNRLNKEMKRLNKGMNWFNKENELI